MNNILFPDYAHTSNNPAVYSISIQQTFNLFALLLVLEYYLGYKIISERRIILGVYVVLVIINYFSLLWKGKDKAIITMFETETEIQRKRGLVFTWFYIIGTYVFFIAVCYL